MTTENKYSGNERAGNGQSVPNSRMTLRERPITTCFSPESERYLNFWQSMQSHIAYYTFLKKDHGFSVTKLSPPLSQAAQKSQQHRPVFPRTQKSIIVSKRIKKKIPHFIMAGFTITSITANNILLLLMLQTMTYPGYMRRLDGENAERGNDRPPRNSKVMYVNARFLGCSMTLIIPHQGFARKYCGKNARDKEEGEREL